MADGFYLGSSFNAGAVLLKYGGAYWLRGGAIAIAAVAAATAVRFELNQFLHNQPFPTFFLAVLIVAAIAGAGPAVVTALISTPVAIFFFIEPTGAFAVESVEDAFRIAIFLILSFGISLFAELRDRSRQRAVAAEIELAQARSREAVDAELRAREAFIRGVLNSLPHEIIVIDDTGAVIAVNERRARFARQNEGAPYAVTLGENYLDVCRAAAETGDAYARQAYDGFRRLLNREEDAFVIEYPRRTDKGDEWFLKFAARSDAAPAAVVVSHTNITERVRAESRLREATERLRDADTRKDWFLATLAHELRNPLAPIRNAAYALQREPAAQARTEREARLLSMIDRQVDHLIRLVDDLLDVSRITRGKIELRKHQVDLAEILQHAIETAQPLIDAGRHTLRVDVGREPLTLEADPVRLTQVFTNLLNNAAKYTESGGDIRVTTAREGENVVIAIRDTGVGIPPEMLTRVFDLFMQVEQSLERAQGGLGIGLTLVKSLVELHGGTIAAQSDGDGSGSAFIVRLPLARTDA